ncbi:MAG: hypothetical protein EBZ77_07860 [Chitinophagia bacterium]|nr:hypothetical protein [Chitinophagia bacterium]
MQQHTSYRPTASPPSFHTDVPAKNRGQQGQWKVILGGMENSDGGFDYVGIFGCQITANRNNSFFANELVVHNMPVTFGGAAGSLFTLPGYGGAVFIN